MPPKGSKRSSGGSESASRPSAKKARGGEPPKDQPKLGAFLAAAAQAPRPHRVEVEAPVLPTGGRSARVDAAFNNYLADLKAARRAQGMQEAAPARARPTRLPSRLERAARAAADPDRDSLSLPTSSDEEDAGSSGAGPAERSRDPLDARRALVSSATALLHACRQHLQATPLRLVDQQRLVGLVRTCQVHKAPHLCALAKETVDAALDAHPAVRRAVCPESGRPQVLTATDVWGPLGYMSAGPRAERRMGDDVDTANADHNVADATASLIDSFR